MLDMQKFGKNSNTLSAVMFFLSGINKEIDIVTKQLHFF